MWKMCLKHTDVIISTEALPIRLFYQALDGALDMPFDTIIDNR